MRWERHLQPDIMLGACKRKISIPGTTKNDKSRHEREHFRRVHLADEKQIYYDKTDHCAFLDVFA